MQLLGAEIFRRAAIFAIPVLFVEGGRRHLEDATTLPLLRRSFHIGLEYLAVCKCIGGGTFARAAMDYKLSVFVIIPQKLLDVIIYSCLDLFIGGGMEFILCDSASWLDVDTLVDLIEGVEFRFGQFLILDLGR